MTEQPEITEPDELVVLWRAKADELAVFAPDRAFELRMCAQQLERLLLDQVDDDAYTPTWAGAPAPGGVPPWEADQPQHAKRFSRFQDGLPATGAVVPIRPAAVRPLHPVDPDPDPFPPRDPHAAREALATLREIAPDGVLPAGDTGWPGTSGPGSVGVPDE